MTGIGVISNPYARVNKKNPKHNTLLWYVLGNKGQYEVTESIGDLSRVCVEFKQNKIATVGVVGGDGTISLTLSALLKAYGAEKLPKILVMRGGTFNVLAANLGIYGKPKNVMADFLEKFHAGIPLVEYKIPSLVVNGRLGFIFANGTASKFLSEFYKNKSNAVGAALFLSKMAAGAFLPGSAGRTFDRITSLERMNMTDETGSSVSDKELSMIFASTVPKLPYGVKLFPNVTLENGQAELIAMESRGKELLAQAVRVLSGLSLKSEKIQSRIFKEITIQVEKDSEFSLDGDVLTTSDGVINVSMGPTFTFCSPYGKVN